MRAAYSVSPDFFSRKTLKVLPNLMVIGLLAIGSVVAQSQKPAPPKPKSRMATAVELTLEKGHEAALPPHVSTLLGISHEQEIPIKQAVEMGEVIRGFEVSTAERNDVVIFVENRAEKDTTFYLTSRTGTLRKVLSVREGTGYSRRPTKDDENIFRKEKQYWLDRLVPKKP
jgi:hypothetical protein